MPRSQQSNGAASSRLARFFRIKHQVVREKSIEFTLIPHVPLLSDYFNSTTELRIHLIEESQFNQNFEFKMTIHAANGNEIHTKLSVGPHLQGSILYLELIDSTYSNWILTAFHEAGKAMGFYAETVDVAEKLELQDRQTPETQKKEEHLKRN